MKKVSGEYEKHHGIKIEKGVVEKICDLTDQYIKSRHFPDKAFDILDEACSQSVLEGSESLGTGTIEQVISNTTGVPLTSVKGEERETLLSLEKTIKNKVIGQDSAVNKVSDSIKRSRIGLKDPNKPIGVYLFIGPTGVGKTLLSKVLSDILFGENKAIRLDMGEYMDKMSVNKITGSPPGYVGYEEGSAFIDEVRKNPYSVVLIDEIEKAHKDVLNVFLQVFDEGGMTDSFGGYVDFRNTIIIMTSNLATAQIMKNRSLGYGSSENSFDTQKKIEKILIEKAEEYFSPEFINRIDNIIIFKKIDEKSAIRILDLEIEKTKKRGLKIGYKLNFSVAAKRLICKNGYSEKYGARPLARTLQQMIETQITTVILDREPQEDVVCISVDVNKSDKKTLEFKFIEKG